MKKGLILALALGGCTTFNNPISLNTLGGMESAYGLALSAAVAYRNLPLCRTGTIATATNVCAQRSIIVKLQNSSKAANVAIHSARDFVVNNPTLDASVLIATAQSALAGFQAVEQTYNIH